MRGSKLPRKRKKGTYSYVYESEESYFSDGDHETPAENVTEERAKSRAEQIRKKRNERRKRRRERDKQPQSKNSVWSRVLTSTAMPNVQCVRNKLQYAMGRRPTLYRTTSLRIVQQSTIWTKKILGMISCLYSIGRYINLDLAKK